MASEIESSPSPLTHPLGLSLDQNPSPPSITSLQPSSPPLPDHHQHQHQHQQQQRLSSDSIDNHLTYLSLADAKLEADDDNVSGGGEDRDEERQNCEENGEKIVEENVVDVLEKNNEEREKEWSRFGKGNHYGGGARFPVRPEAEDCSFYVRTGSCKFGMNCKFNHPPNHHLLRRAAQGAKVKAKEACVDSVTLKVNEKEKDESVDKEQIDCKYFDRPGGCKFGKACKFNHSRKMNSTCKLNFMGLPIRPEEKECPFYMRNGLCKFAANCRFDHPEPTSRRPDALLGYNNGGSVFPPNASQSHHLAWSPPTTLKESPPYVPLMFSPTQGFPAQPQWNSYQAPLYPPEMSIQIPPSYAVNNQLSERLEQMVGDQFPERPGQLECSYFLKTGTCKYKSACKFHHPKSAIPESPSCLLSDLGLPLRPGENVCSYYSRYGICKYGPACKYDHPINYVHSSDLNVTAVDQAPVLVDSMVNNQAMVAGS